MLSEYDIEIMWTLGYSPNDKGEVVVRTDIMKSKFRVVHIEHKKKLAVLMGGIPLHASVIYLEDLKKDSGHGYFPDSPNSYWEEKPNP